MESNIRKKPLLVPSITEDFVDAMGFQLYRRELNEQYLPIFHSKCFSNTK